MLYFEPPILPTLFCWHNSGILMLKLKKHLVKTQRQNFCSLTIDFNPTLKAHVAIWAVNCRFPFGKERFTALVESSQHKSPLLTVASEIKPVKWMSMNLDFGQKYLNKSAEHSYTEQDLITDKVFKYYSSVAAM